MSTLSRSVVAALTLVLAGTLVMTVDGSATAASSRGTTASAPTADPGKSRGLALGDDVVRPPGARKAAPVKKWAVRTLRYHEALPPKWDWSLRTAVAKWNGAGGGIRLVRVAKAKQAHVRITYGNIGGAAGQATLGAAKNAFVRLSSRFSPADGTTARNRVTVMNVLAHELGHVLGFRHVSTRCALMAPVINLDACGTLPPDRPGYYKCRTLDTALVRRFVALYGGRARFPVAAWCLIDPLPAALANLSFTGGDTGPVTLHWRPVTLPAGSSLVVRRWESSSCTTVPTSADMFRPAPSSGVWQDSVATEASTACFRIQPVNRYGAGPAAQTRLLTRWVAPVDQPTIGSPTYDADTDAFTFAVTLSDDLLLQARWDAATPGTCMTTPVGATNVSYVPVSDGQGTLGAPAVLPQCVSFFAYDPETNRFSAPVPVTFTPPESTMPDAPVIEEPTWDPVRPAFLAPATYPEGTHLVYASLGDADTCPGDYTAGTPVEEDPETMGEGVIGFMTAAPDECVSFYAIDDETGEASAPTEVTVSAPLPTEPINAEERLEPWGYPWWYVRATGIAAGNHLGYSVMHGPCPETAPQVSVWRTQLLSDTGDWPAPEARSDGMFPSQGAGANCVLVTSLDWWGYHGSRSTPWTMTDRHGPVVMREFVDEGPLDPTVGTPVWKPSTGRFDVPVSRTAGVKAIYDPSDPTTCPLPGAVGAQAIFLPQSSLTSFELTPPATPYSCVTFYVEANDGPVRRSLGVPVDLDVPQG